MKYKEISNKLDQIGGNFDYDLDHSVDALYKFVKSIRPQSYQKIMKTALNNADIYTKEQAIRINRENLSNEDLDEMEQDTLAIQGIARENGRYSGLDDPEDSDYSDNFDTAIDNVHDLLIPASYRKHHDFALIKAFANKVKACQSNKDLAKLFINHDLPAVCDTFGKNQSTSYDINDNCLETNDDNNKLLLVHDDFIHKPSRRLAKVYDLKPIITRINKEVNDYYAYHSHVAQ